MNLPRNLPKWPEEWDMHMLNMCDLYFDGKELQFINGLSTYEFIVGTGDDENKIKKLVTVQGLREALFFQIDRYSYYWICCRSLYSPESGSRNHPFTAGSIHCIDELSRPLGRRYHALSCESHAE